MQDNNNTSKNPQLNTTDTKQLFELVTGAYEATNANLTGVVLTYTQQAVLWLYDALGLNPFPIKIASKEGGVWKQLQFTRLDRHHPDYGLLEVFRGRCNIAVMVGATSGNLTVLDCETEPLFKWVIRCLKERQIPVWAVKTARGGHVWLRVAEGTVKSITTADFAKHHLQMEVRGNKGYVFAPPSVHPTGTLYDWQERQGDTIPVVSIEQIDFLPMKLELVKKPKKPSTRNTGIFWNSTREYLKSGHTYTEGQRHTGLFNAIVDYARNGYTRNEMERDLVPVAQRSGLPDDGDKNLFDRLISWALNNKHKWAVKNLRVFDWQRATAFVEDRPWLGRTGNTDRAVALALVECAKSFTNPNGTFRASYREIGTLARVTDRRTLGNALDRLKAIPFVLWAGNDKASKASLWRFSDKTLSTSSEQFTTFERLETDALERGAIGQSGSRVWQALLAHEKPAKTAEIAIMAGLTPKQAAYALRRDGWLRLSELVKRTPEGWVALPATNEQLDESVARPAGKLGNGKRRKVRFDRDRAIDAGKAVLRWRFNNDQGNLYV